MAPNIYERDGFVVTLWTYYEPATAGEVSPADYATALERLHAGMRKVKVSSPLHGSRRPGPKNWWRAGTTLRRSPTQTGSCSATHYET